MLRFIEGYKKYVSRTLYLLAALLLIFMTGLAFVQMITRYAMGVTFYWADEITVFCITSIIALTVPGLWLARDNITMDIISGLLSKKVDFAVDLVMNVLGLIASVIFTYSGFKAVFLNKGYVISILRYDESIKYWFVPFMGVMLCINITLTLIETLIRKSLERGGEADDC